MIYFGIVCSIIVIATIVGARYYVKKQWNTLEHLLNFSAEDIKRNASELVDSRNGKLENMVRKLYESLSIEYSQADKEKE